MNQIVPPKVQIDNSEGFKKKSQGGLKLIFAGIILVLCGGIFLFFPMLADMELIQKFGLNTELVIQIENVLGYALCIIGILVAGFGLNKIPNVKQPPDFVIH